MIGGEKICGACKHYREMVEVGDYVLFDTCKAFPQGIPARIIGGTFIHDKPYPKDGGVRFEPVPDSGTVT